MITLLRSSVLLLTLLVAGLPVRAQSWDVVRGLKPGDRVKLLETGGKEHKGDVTTVTPEAISLQTGKTQVSVDRTRVKRVQVYSGSRRARNVAIGAGIGVAIGVIVDQTLGTYLRNETGDSGRAVTYLAPIALFGGLGALGSPYRTIYRVK